MAGGIVVVAMVAEATSMKISVKRELIVKGCKKDFGEGKGVVASEVTEYDVTPKTAKSAMFQASVFVFGEDEFIARHAKVRTTILSPKKKP